MGLFDFLFSKPVTIQHAFWGELKFVADDLLQGDKLFTPTGKILGISIDADANGPISEQEIFFSEIEAHYREICQSIIPVLEDVFDNWQEGFKIKDFSKEFELVYISLPKCNVKPVEWEAAYESIHDKNHTFTLTIYDYTAQHVLIDG